MIYDERYRDRHGAAEQAGALGGHPAAEGAAHQVFILFIHRRLRVTAYTNISLYGG
jgi:hypothetical protein